MITTIYGHRGARGLYPENTIFGFEKCLDNDLNGFELDVVVSKDHQLIVSHEPWMNYKFCSHPNEIPITRKNQATFNLYKMTVEEIQQFDCGSKLNINYPYQQLTPCVKPTLAELFVRFNAIKHKSIAIQIELKSYKKWYGIYQPQPDVYAQIIIDFFKQHKLDRHQIVIKSFDTKLLNLIYQSLYPLEIGLLVDNRKSIKNNLKRIKFKPHYYNLNQKRMSAKIVKQLNDMHIKTVPWTVNSIKDMLRLEKMGVDAIITDYPNLFTDRFED